MANGIRTGKTHGFNKRCNSKFCVSSWVWQTSEEGRRIYWPKRCGNNNKDKFNSTKTLNDKKTPKKNIILQLLSRYLMFWKTDLDIVGCFKWIVHFQTLKKYFDEQKMSTFSVLSAILQYYILAWVFLMYNIFYTHIYRMAKKLWEGVAMA